MSTPAPNAKPGRWVLPLVEGRGAGLGNELVAWARAELMAQVLGAQALSPAFGLNRRAYWRHFNTSRLDWLRARAMTATLPARHFGEADYLRCGGGDVVTAFSRYVDEQQLVQRGLCLVTTDGMWGGFAHIARARDWARARLAGSRWAAANLATLGARLHPERLTIAMHVRLGDFEPPRSIDDYRGRFNLTLPLDWFVSAGLQLQAAFGERVQFQVFSDGSAEQLAPLTQCLRPVSTACQHPADVSDLLAMAQADLLMCSVSSYSAWAAFLSDAPYCWFGPHLHPLEGGWGAIWGHEAAQQAPGSPSQQAWAAALADPADVLPGRGHALWPGADLPDALLTQLATRLAMRRQATDLVRYGVAPSPPLMRAL